MVKRKHCTYKYCVVNTIVKRPDNNANILELICNGYGSYISWSTLCKSSGILLENNYQHSLKLFENINPTSSISSIAPY